MILAIVILIGCVWAGFSHSYKAVFWINVHPILVAVLLSEVFCEVSQNGVLWLWQKLRTSSADGHFAMSSRYLGIGEQIQTQSEFLLMQNAIGLCFLSAPSFHIVSCLFFLENNWCFQHARKVPTCKQRNGGFPEPITLHVGTDHQTREYIHK